MNKSNMLMSEEEIQDLKDRFYEYLCNKYPDKNRDRHKEDKSWAFALLRHDIGIDFFYSLEGEETLDEYYKCILNKSQNGGFSGKGVKNPVADAKAYLNSVRRLKEYMDDIYGGVKNYVKQNYDV